MTAPEQPRSDLGPLICVVGARPNFMKMAPIWRALETHLPDVPRRLVHTGQHYDAAMSERFFADLGLPAPDVNLEVGSGTHAVQTAEILRRFEPVLDREGASAVVVVGDVNSTIACALVAAKKGVPVVHVEAGLRSGDRTMPEEINRLLTDRIADRLYVTEREAIDNLRKEGIEPERICFAGNVMIDSLLHARQQAASPAGTLTAAGVDPATFGLLAGYALVTLHRPSNVDDPDHLAAVLGVLGEVAAMLPIVFMLHPRTRNNAEKFGLHHLLHNDRIAVLPPQGYRETLGLMAGAAVVLTDSGGMQEETTALGIPCLTLRENTERPITVHEGTNTLVGRGRAAILDAVRAILAGEGKRGRVPELWDGRAAERIVIDLAGWLMSGRRAMRIS